MYCINDKETIMTEAQKKILDALLEKIKRDFSDAVDALGIYGSVSSGDIHPKSDLDLLILINDAKAYPLSQCFILDDEKIGYDIYCTTWQMLEGDAQCNHAHLSKLMDSEIVYVRDADVTKRIGELKNQVRQILSSDIRFKKAGEIGDRVFKKYARALTSRSIGKLRSHAAEIIYTALDFVMIFNGRYFKKGIKRAFEELDGLELPKDFCTNIKRIVSGKSEDEVRMALTDLIWEQLSFMDNAEKASDKKEKDSPAKDNIGGTYEEMFSNWKNKMGEAAEHDDVFSSFMNLASFQYMLDEISGQVDIRHFDVMENFNPDNLLENAETLDDTLEKYLQEYKKIGLEVKCYKNADEFVKSYLK